jgi:hypothetical protein
MAFDWKNAGGRAPELELGDHKVTIKTVRRTKKDGTAFTSNDGSPQLFVVYADSRGAEAGQMFTLSDKAGWSFAALLNACEPPFDFERMMIDRIEPAHFANEVFALRNLVDKQRTVHIRIKLLDKVDRNGNPIRDISPIRAEFAQVRTTPPASQPTKPASKPIDADELPF